MEGLPSLTGLQELLTTRSVEAESIKNDLEKARELLASCDTRLKKLIGVPTRPEPQKSLKTFIHHILNTANEPLTVREITELVLENGYKSGSKNFCNVVNQCLVNDAEIKRKTRPKTKPARYALEEV